MKNKDRTRIDSLLDKLKNNPVVSLLIVLGIIVIALASFSKFVRDLVDIVGESIVPAPAPLIREARSLIGVGGYILQEDLRNGSLAYTDRVFQYGNLPGYLVGAYYVQTPNGTKYGTESKTLRLELTRNATVYVAFDHRWSTLPKWLQSWESTSDSVLVGTTRHDLYAKTFPEGSVDLGGNRSPDNPGIGKENNGMYCVVV